VFPEVDRAVPAVVIIHENRGLNDWARGVADQIAEAGYVALAPDLLSGTGPDGGGTSSFKSVDDARNAISALTAGQVMADLDAVVAHARAMDATTDTVAVGGFCWGGGQTFSYAARNPEIAAAYVFYGRSVTDEEELAKIKAPVYGFYGGDDFRITGSVEGVAASMKKLGRTFEPVVYEGAGHAFLRSGETAAADHPNRKAYLAAWQRWKELLRRLDAPGTEPGAKPGAPPH
jgi:carboxymethylenebutenolidase